MGFGVMRAQALYSSSANDVSSVAQFSHGKMGEILTFSPSGWTNYPCQVFGTMPGAHGKCSVSGSHVH